MRQAGSGYMPLGRQLFTRTAGDALGDLARQKYGTAKAVARAWGLDPATAANLFKGHLSVPTLMKALSVEGWGLWEALGSELTGETYHQYEERKLQRIIKEAEDARQNLVRIRARREALEQGSSDVDRSRRGEGAQQRRDRHG